MELILWERTLLTMEELKHHIKHTVSCQNLFQYFLDDNSLPLESWVSRNGQEPVLPGLNLTPEQLFWVSGANVWCSKHRPGDLRMNVMLGTHTPANYRIKGAFSNLEDFSRDFQCKVGSQMNPMTHQKCKVW